MDGLLARLFIGLGNKCPADMVDTAMVATVTKIFGALHFI